MKTPSSPQTPLMKQFLEIKQDHPEAILFFRVGDFYEMFYEDAVEASKILQITLTSRNKNKKDAVPLCGLPYHAASGYIARLIRAGKSVAVCEQVEDPATAKGLVRREVTRVITPGTVIEPELLSEKENNFLVALKMDAGASLARVRRIGLACLDLSTGAFRLLAEDVRWSEAEAELMKIDPKEILLSKKEKGRDERMQPLLERWPIRFVSAGYFVQEEAEAALSTHLKVHSTAAIGGGHFSLAAAGALLLHLQEIEQSALENIRSLKPIPLTGLMRIHPLALRHLDLIPLFPSQKGKTLLDLLDKTLTAMGGRLLKEWLLRPLLLSEAIQRRQAGLAFFYENLSLRTAFRSRLKALSDLERLIGRITLKAAQPRDLISLKESLAQLPGLHSTLSERDVSSLTENHPIMLSELLSDWDNLERIHQLIEVSIEPDPPPSLKDGGVIRSGYLEKLDALRRFQKEGRSMLTEIELKERRRTGIESLKVRYNQVFGYYFEVSKTHLKKVPEDYVRKQTLSHAERFMTAELNLLAERLSQGKEAVLRLEKEAFEEVRAALSQEAAAIQKMAHKIAVLDLLAALAELAHQNNYCRPVLSEGLKIRIVEGRHPVLEVGGGQIGKGGFIPNDVLIDPPSERLLILTGPNMAGKSTYMRQTALIILMAQMGAYVPAREAEIGVVDQIFTRVGAQDALTEGMSTFMVEMSEMSQILRHATGKSLILLDEIGRGTSTFDGMSIAWAIAAYVHSNLGARTLFATHYHELTALAIKYEGIQNYHVLVREWGEEIVFLRKMVAGGADRSYGIQVGRLAGLPPEIIKAAKAVLKSLEEQASASPIHLYPGASVTARSAQPSLFAPTPPQADSAEHPVLGRLRKLDLMNMTPLQALQVLSELSDEARETPEKA